MYQKKLATTAFIALLVLLIPSLSFAATQVAIAQALKDCTAAGNKIVGTPIQSELKKQTSLIGMAYLNYLYQNDLTNPHFCQSMLLMNSQVPSATTNPYEHLFDAEMAPTTMPILQDIQLSFDYSIGRTNPPIKKIEASVKNIQAVLKNY